MLHRIQRRAIRFADMARIVVCGGGICGLIAGMLLADSGQEVTVLERDAAAPSEPADAWDHWERRGVNQFRLPHFLMPRFREEMGNELPRLVDALVDAGAYRFNMMTGQADGGDPSYDIVTARRPLLEAVAAKVAASTPRLTLRRGVAIAGLAVGPCRHTGVPHVAGVETEHGERIDADLVIDATGRRSPLPRWLAAVGAVAPTVEEDDSGFVYYGRHVRSTDGNAVVAGPSNERFGSVSLLVLPADHGTAGVGLIACNKDAALRCLKDEGAWNAVVAAVPGGQRILDCQPISPMTSMAKLEDRWRRFVVNGEPVATGVLAVADSWAATNPTRGRGITFGTLHAIALRDVVAKVGVDDPYALALAFDEVTERDFTPWYRATLWEDRHSRTDYESAMTGAPRPPDAQWHDWQRFPAVAMSTDPSLLVGLFDAGATLRRTVFDVLADPAVQFALAASAIEPPPERGPTRAELLSLAGVG